MQEMDVGKNIYEEEGGGGISLDMGKLAKNLLNKLWVILIVGGIFAGAGFTMAKSSYVKVYSSETTLSFMVTDYVIVKDYSGRKDALTEYKQETDFYTSADAKTYQALLKSDEMISRIYNGLKEVAPDSDYTESFIRDSLSVEGIPEDIAGFFVMTVTSTDEGYCERALDVVIDLFPDYIQEFDSRISIKVIKSPSTPSVTNGDDATNKAIYGFMIGAAIVAIIIVIITMLTHTVTTLENLRRDVNARVLGSVPLIEKPTGLFGKKSKIPQGSLLITDSSKVSFAFVESFKSIRTKLENIKAEKGHKAFVVTSTYEDEGKTTVAVNIACALAQKGKSVLLIDSDLRKPAVLHAVGVKSDTSYGLIPIIKGTSTYIDSIKFIKSLGIFVLPTGGISLKSTEVLDADKVKNVIQQARKEFDYIIIDSPPSHVVTDSLVIAPLADGIIYTIRRDYAKVAEINRTLEEIRTADIEVIGTIFTMSNGEENSHYYKKKGYYLRYGGYYGRRRRKKNGYGNYGGYGNGGGYGSGGYGGYGYGGYGYGGYGYGGYGYGGYGYGGNGYGYGYGGYGYGSASSEESKPAEQENNKIDNE